MAFILPMTLHADVITFRVIDAQTHEPIEGAMYECELRWDYSIARQSGYETDSLGSGEMFFGTDCPHVTLKVECPGYYSAKRVFAISDGTDTLALGDIALKPSEVLLNEAVVTARAKRFTIRGDTVVFNPEAFQLEEGARLEELIKKLPGVSIQDGELRWNGKPVRILVQGQESLSANLLSQLPAEAVDKIKGYNKQSEAARKAGCDDGGEDLVLDLQIKEGWLDKWYASLQAMGQTPRHALVMVDGLRLGTKEQAMVFADWNNVGNRYGRSFGGTSYTGYGKGKQTAGA
ncbi:MAG: TonB-dependent receptor, partial [Bacteroidaceae bacterium]|nr:TonB-dependent receptor [Bacteroidaceae bacterium]